jgi:four helix bundle protein
MTRRYEDLQTFKLADALVIDIYEHTRAFPVSERFGLQSQLRRAAVSVVANIIEGSARPTVRDYSRFLHLAIGSASEMSYLLTLAGRLSLAPIAQCQTLAERYRHVTRALLNQVAALHRLDAEPRAEKGRWLKAEG